MPKLRFRLWWSLLLFVFSACDASEQNSSMASGTTTEKPASFTCSGKISARREAPDVATFDESIAEGAMDEEKGATDGDLAAGRKLAEQVNEAEKPIVVVIPSYNNREWYQRNLGSVLSQNYHNFRVIYIDDASPDGTGKLIKAWVKSKNQEHRVTLVQNTKRTGALSNVYKGIWMCAPHEIVANLDGDDWFKDENVLARLNQAYSDPDVWVTYGQFVYYPCGTKGWAAQVPPEVIAQNAFRDYNWVSTALRSFYAGLFHRIRIDDLLYNGEFFPMAGDLAYMWCIMEMAGTHSRFIPDVLYVYNKDTSLNDDKVDHIRQRDLGLETRNKPRYSPVAKPY